MTWHSSWKNKGLFRKFAAFFLFFKKTETLRDSTGSYLLPPDSQIAKSVKTQSKTKRTSGKKMVQIFGLKRFFVHHFRKFDLSSAKKYLRPIFALVLVIVLVAQIFSPNGNNVLGATFTFTQTSWAGGANASAVAVHPGDETGYTVYNSKDANLNVVNAGADLRLATSTSFVTSTDDGTTNTGFNLTGKIFTQTSIVGGGASAGVQLAQSSATAGGNGADGAVTISTTTNINTTAIASGRTCADGIAYSVISLTSNSATLGTTPSAGCLNNGDKVFLINLQGDSTTSTNTGNYEFFTISSISSNVINFSSSKNKFYGNAVNSDSNIGTSTTKQRVVLQRVPQYTNVTINNGGSLTVSAWDGQKGGVLVFFANGTVNVQSGGSLNASGKGYRGGPAGGNSTSYQGESFNRLGVKSSIPNDGAGGGAGYDVAFCGPYGQRGNNGTYSSVVSGAYNSPLIYGLSDLSKIYFGSGGGAGNYSAATAAGGILFVEASILNISGTVSSNGNNDTSGVAGAGSGGSIFLKGDTLNLGTALVSASGGQRVNGGSGSDPECGTYNFGADSAGDGRIFINSNNVSGSTLPSATIASFPTTYYTSGTYTSGAIDIGMVVESWNTLSYDTTLNGQTITLKARSGNSSDLSDAPAWTSCSNIASGALFSTGGCVTSGQRYVQYQATFSSADNSITPVLNSVTIGYNLYVASATLTSVPYDSGDSTNILGSINWDEDATLPSGTTVTMELRSANNSSMTGASAWGSPTSCTKSGQAVSCPYSTLPAAVKDGVNDRYFQYRLTLASTGSYTPTISEVRTQYVINIPPEVQNVTASQNSDGTVSISYQVRSADTATDNGSVGVVTPSFQYCVNGGVSCTNISALSANATSTKAVDPTNWTTYNVTWIPTTDFPNTWDPTAKIKVTVNDLQAANNLASTSSPAFVLDTAAPVGSFTVSASTTPAILTVTATDSSTPIMMRFADSQVALASATYVPYSVTSTYTLPGNPATIYAQFKDAKSNETNPSLIHATTPETIANFMVQDTSNLKNSPPDYREFLAWRVVGQPSAGFGAYKVYRSLDNSNWVLISSITDRSVNFFLDTSVPALTTVYYKIITVDSLGNGSFPSAVIQARADGIQNYVEGGGGTGTGPAISNVATSTPSASSIEVTWDTDGLANSTVSYSTTAGVYSNSVTVGSLVNNSQFNGPHRVILANLNPDTTYYFNVKSTDINGNYTVDDNGGTGYSFHTTPGPTVSAGPTPVSVLNTSATIAWQTSLSANATIFYSTTSDFSASETVSDLVSYDINHELTLTGLSPSTKYYFYVRSIDGSGNIVYDQNVLNGVAQYFNFYTTNDIVAPQIINPNATVNLTNATIIWNTNEPADSQINYGLTNSYGSSTVLSPALNSSHTVTLANLIPNTTYHYQVLSRDGNGNLASSADYTFLTGTPVDTTPPIITNVATSSISISSATITWDTNKNTNATVDFGTTPSYGSLMGNLYDFTTTSHSITLTDLLGNTLYYFRVNSADSIGNSSSSTGTFFTEPDVTPPVISNTSTLANDTAAFVNWVTNEMAFSEVNYGTSTENLNIQVTITSTPRTNHSLPLTGLSPSTTYYYNIVSADPSANTSTVGPYSFITPEFGMQTIIIDNTKPTVVIDNTKPSDTSAPNISDLRVNDITAFGATITWNSDEIGNSLVRYGRSLEYGSLAGNEEDQLSAHSVSLVNLNPATTYHFKARTADSSGNLGSSADTTFTTLNIDGTEAKPSDTPVNTEEEKQQAEKQFILDKIVSAPLNLLSGILEAIASNPFLRDMSEDNAIRSFSTIVSQVGEAPIIVGLRPQVEVHGNTAIIRWSTDKKTTGLVSFAREKDYLAGSDRPYTTTIVDGDNISTVHSIELTGLESAARYHYQVTSKGEVGPEARSKDYTFETEAVLPIVSDIKVSDIKANSAIISWKTNVPTASTLEYTNLTTQKVLSSGDPALLIMHTFNLQSLDPGVKYNLVIKAKNESGQEQPSDAVTFETVIDKDGPVIQSVLANSTLYPGATSKVQTIISWETDEEATCLLSYQLGVKDDPDRVKTAEKENIPARKHFIVLTAFTPGNVYKYWVDCADQSGNKSSSDKFTTLTPVEQQTIIDIITNNFQSVFGWTKNVGR